MIKRMSFVLNVIMVVMCFTTVLQGMQPAEPKECSSLALSLILYNRHLSFGHDDICSFALVNKENKNIIQKTAQERRGFLAGLMVFSSHDANSYGMTWDKHGTMCVGKKIKNKRSNPHADLRFFISQSKGLVDDDIGFLFPYHPSKEYQSLFNDVKIMENEVCYYNLHKHESHVYEYSFFRDKTYCRRECMVKINNGDEKVYPLVGLVDFPSLFKALFNACVKEKNETEVIHDLNSAIIPHSFKEARDTYSFEKNLSQPLQDAIIKRYEEQPKK
jgi:hypothetical protein